MTIIEPNRKKFRITPPITILGVLIIMGMLGSVVAYQNVVSLRHDIKNLDAARANLENDNAELQSSLYTLLSPENMKKMAREEGLIQEKNPSYLEANKNLAAGSDL